MGLCLVLLLLCSCQKEVNLQEKKQKTKITDIEISTDPDQPILLQAIDQDEIPDNEIAALTALGYLGGYEDAPSESGVTVSNENLWCPGINLIVSGHSPEVTLMDMKGRILHKWHYPLKKAFPNHPNQEKTNRANSFRRAFLLPEGDLLAIYNRIGLIRLDKDSNLRWKICKGIHHDLDITESGQIFALLSESKIIPHINPKNSVLEEFIAEISPSGELKQQISLLKCFENSDYAPYLDSAPSKNDIFHTNTIQVMDGSLSNKSEIFKKGNCLVSLRHLNAIAIIDLKAESVVWALSGMWLRQHEPVLLPSGKMIIFDNCGMGSKSRILEFDPFSQKISWDYSGDHEHKFFSSTSGSCQRLTNGNTLIIESNSGRAFEVTPKKSIVWEYLNPERWGRRKNLIATLFDVVRIPEETVSDWLKKDEKDN